VTVLIMRVGINFYFDLNIYGTFVFSDPESL